MTKEFCKSLGLRETKPVTDETITDFEISCFSAYICVRFLKEKCDSYIVIGKDNSNHMLNKVISNAPKKDSFLMAVKICKCEGVLNLKDVQ